MTAYVPDRLGRLIDSATGSVVGLLDAKGNEQMLPLNANQLGLGLANAATVPYSQANTVMLMGDSINALSLVVTGNNFINRASEGWFNWFDAYLGAPFNLIGSTAVGGKTTDDVMATQLAVVLAAQPKYCEVNIGINDINILLRSGEVTAANVITIIKKLLDAGIVPIWTTLYPQTYDSVVTPKVTRCNDILRRFAYTQKSGIFVDGYLGRVDPTNSQNQSRGASYSYDSPPYLHPNNLGAFAQGLFVAGRIGSQFPSISYSQSGNEDVTYTDGASNLLSNPGFTGTGGTVSANCTGTMPTGWVIDWATRTGTGSAAAAIVNVTDTLSGLVVGQAIQVTISGTCASGDVLRVSQSDAQNATLKANLSTGNVVQAEGVVSGASLANVSGIAMRVQANTNESTWWGSNGQTAGTYPATVPAMTMRTYPLTVLGSGVASQARHDFRFTFNGVGTGSVFTISRPRVRKVS